MPASSSFSFSVTKMVQLSAVEGGSVGYMAETCEHNFPSLFLFLVLYSLHIVVWMVDVNGS